MLPAVARKPVSRLVRLLSERAFGPRRVDGAPPGIARETLDALCREHLGRRLDRCAYVHLSSWKPCGTYRLRLSTDAGTTWQLIFKDEIYAAETIPALQSLPILPGPPEFAIYQVKEPRFATFLPDLHWSCELEPGRHFQYVMADLGQGFERMRKDRQHLILAARALVEFQAALKEACGQNPHPYLITYDRRYSEALLDYVAKNLETYRTGRHDRAIDELCRNWRHVVAVHQRDEFYQHRLHAPIHGDYNRSNVHLHARDPAQAKVVDWEWAGIGVPHADLAALLKRVDPDDEHAALAAFVHAHPELDAASHQRLLRWCQLERRLLDAGFLARQQMASTRRVRWLEGYIRRAAADVMLTVQRLEAAPRKALA